MDAREVIIATIVDVLLLLKLLPVLEKVGSKLIN